MKRTHYMIAELLNYLVSDIRRREWANAISLLVELDDSGFKQALSPRVLSAIHRRSKSIYHGGKDDFVVSTQTVLLGRFTWPSYNKVIQVQCNISLAILSVSTTVKRSGIKTSKKEPRR